jgi:hypothetical protein
MHKQVRQVDEKRNPSKRFPVSYAQQRVAALICIKKSKHLVLRFKNVTKDLPQHCKGSAGKL